jgi:serine/threonine-protein kinase
MGTYRKKRKIGSGGFGEVWLCEHEELGIELAVKFIPASKIPDPPGLFYEPRLLKLLEHPNIVRVHDAGIAPSGDVYVAMDYLPARSLEDYLKKNPIKLRRLKPIFCEALRGLQYAHDHQYIHRDIKPANIMLGAGLKGLLSDFGLAKMVGPAGNASWAGTPMYIAPETVTKDETSVASDIYGMGVALYESINGESYFPAVSSVTELNAKIASGEFPDRGFYRPYVPKQLLDVVNKALHVDKAKRHKSADELREELEQVPIKCSWREKRSGNSIIWTAKTVDFRYEIRMDSRSGLYDLEVLFCRLSSDRLRRATRLCTTGLNQTRALAHVRKIARALTVGKQIANL